MAVATANQGLDRMHTSRETDDLNVTEPEVTSFEVAEKMNLEPPRELLREVASNLKSLATILPYAEYAAIVRRIAEVRWRCEVGIARSASLPSHPGLPNAVGNT
jgi:hypothetical protein